MSKVYLLVDGENIDRTLGQILNSKPAPNQRPRWDKILQFVESHYKKDCKALFFLNASRGLPGTFVQALLAARYVPIPLVGDQDLKIVDEGINKTLRAIAETSSDCSVCLVSHDADFIDSFKFLADGKRDLSVAVFAEYLSGSYSEIEGLRVFDLEDEVGAFQGASLPRLRPISLDEFDPCKYL